MTDPVAEYKKERTERIAGYADMADWKKASNAWLDTAFRQQYMYNFSWMDRPIIQLPADMVAFQELVWKVRPDVILETGIAHGGSLIYSAALLSQLDVCDAIEAGKAFNPAESKRKVIGIDIDIRAHNRAAIENHPMSTYLTMIQGSSTEQSTHDAAVAHIEEGQTVMVCLDSNHTEDHVMKELELYAKHASKGSYCIVFDTIVEDLAQDMFPNRPWEPGDNPKTAVWKYMDLLKSEGRTGEDGQPLNFEIDRETEGKLLLSVAPDGFLKRV